MGVFTQYTKAPGTEPFKKFNLIYGLNGSGKTTLSRLFSAVNTGKYGGFDDLKYKVTATEGGFTEKKPYTRSIRVFNSDYVEENIGQLDGKLNPIYVVGAENKNLALSVASDETTLTKLEELHTEKNEYCKKLKLERGKIFTNIAREISKIASGTATRNYKKNNAEKAFEKLDIPKILSVEDLAQASKKMKQETMSKNDELSLAKVGLTSLNSEKTEFFAALSMFEDSVAKITRKSSTSIAISRLTSQPEIAQWVEDGVAIHKNNNDNICEYCRQDIPENRLKQLADHFNDSDRLLKNEIEYAIEEANEFMEAIKNFGFLDSVKLYPELQEEYRGLVKELKGVKKRIIAHLEYLIEELNTKLKHRTESSYTSIEKYTSIDWHNKLKAVNSLVSKHNLETDYYKKRLDACFTEIEIHFLSGIVGEVKKIDKGISDTENDIAICLDGNSSVNKLGITGIKKQIERNRAKISNSHQAAIDLSQMLTSFLGRDDLRFEPEGDGYRIMRFSRAAKHLSEGEKTAITFLYFVMGLKDRDFDAEEDIVVIDDPISSLDSSSIYQAFSFLKNAVKDVRQVFLLTHNFDFLKLLLNWLKKAKSKTYWMLHCECIAGKRESTIKPLDKVLQNNKNEFAYLLKLLIEFKSDGTIGNAYHIPNIIRKILETFLEQHTSGGSLYKQLEEIEFDEIKKSAIYKYANDLSHSTSSGIDPALVVETQTNTKHLLEMIETVAPVHYKALTSIIAVSD